MKSQILTETPDAELEEMLVSEKEKLYKMRMSHAVSPLENPKLISSSKKQIARIKTEMSIRNNKKENSIK
ncbi:MAG: 50S ribosomal protein L29 [Flavobacteriales bacterium]|nr:50S ribosomal protein L29 [Flavobacteriales bacterium]